MSNLSFFIPQVYGEEKCTDMQEADINFIVDASSSVGPENWNALKAFMNQLVDRLVIGDDKVSIVGQPGIKE